MMQGLIEFGNAEPLRSGCRTGIWIASADTIEALWPVKSVVDPKMPVVPGQEGVPKEFFAYNIAKAVSARLRLQRCNLYWSVTGSWDPTLGRRGAQGKQGSRCFP